MTQPARTLVTGAFDAPPRAHTDEERLAAYLEGPYSRQREEVAKQFNWLKKNPSRRAIFELSIDALYFLSELAYWKRFAADLNEVKLGEELRRARDNAESAQDTSRSSTKRPAAEVQAEARQHSRSYRSALTLLTDSRSDLERVISWAQTMLKEMKDEEFSGEAAGAAPGENDHFAEAPVQLT